jgi:hypothetical protein
VAQVAAPAWPEHLTQVLGKKRQSAVQGHFGGGAGALSHAKNLLMDYPPTIAALERTRDTPEVPLGRRVDVVEREAAEVSRNPIRRCRILAEARPLYAA